MLWWCIEVHGSFIIANSSPQEAGEEKNATVVWSVQGVSRSVLRKHDLSLDNCLYYMKIEAFALNLYARVEFV